MKDHVGVVKLLLNAPRIAAILALRDKDGDTPLLLATSYGRGVEALVAALLEADVAGVTVNAQNKQGSSALTSASYRGYEGAVRLLLARGARQGLQDADGSTAMHCAAYRGHTSVARLLCAAPGATAALALQRV